MILAIDIGNTTASMAVLEGDTLLANGKVSTLRTQTAEDALPTLLGILHTAGVCGSDVEGSIMTSVVPRLTPVLGECVRRATGRDPFMVSCRMVAGFQICLENPAKVGHDRLVDLAYAAHNFPLPAMTVDMGTATTFSVLDKNANFIGGMIAPGLGTSLHALSARAAQLPAINIETPAKLIGGNTQEAMLSGAVTGAACLIDDMARRVEQQLGQPISLLVTGGLAKSVVPLCSHPLYYDPDLLFKGLALLWRLNHRR